MARYTKASTQKHISGLILSDYAKTMLTTRLSDDNAATNMRFRCKTNLRISSFVYWTQIPARQQTVYIRRN